jgi:hypothetical protein
MLKALVISPNERSRDMGDLLAIARAEAQKREHTRENITVRSITFIPECGVYVALYEAPGVQRLPGARDRRKR